MSDGFTSLPAFVAEESTAAQGRLIDAHFASAEGDFKAARKASSDRGAFVASLHNAPAKLGSGKDTISLRK
jgi:hypothetical protein